MAVNCRVANVYVLTFSHFLTRGILFSLTYGTYQHHKDGVLDV